MRKKSLLNNSLLFTATFPVISNMSFCAPCSSNIFILSDFWIPKRSPLSPFQAEERAKSQSSHYLLNVDHLNACDDKTSFNESHASLSMKLSFVLKWRCFPIIFLLCISRNSSFRFFKKSLFGSPFVLAKVRIALKTCKERPFLQAGNLILEMRSKTGQCHPVCHIDFSCSELHISRQSDDYPARRGFFNGYHPYNRGICSLWRTFQQHLFKVFRWDRGSSPEKRLGSKTGDSSLKEAKSKRRYLGARGRAFCAMALASFNSNVLWSKLWVKRWILLQIAPSKNRPWKWLVSVPAIVLLRIRL